MELLFRAIPQVKILAPPTACLSPIGEDLLEAGLTQRIGADFAAITRPPSVYRGNPFQVEVGLAYGGPCRRKSHWSSTASPTGCPCSTSSPPAPSPSRSCPSTGAPGLQQSRGALPHRPLVLFVHVVSVWVPFTSESKEAVASYPEIMRDIRLALMEVGRRLGAFVRHRRRTADEMKKRTYIEKYIPHIGDALQQILGFPDKRREQTVETLKEILERSRKL